MEGEIDMNIKEISDRLTLIKENMAKVVVGKEQALDLMLIALLCRGHVLLEDVPGIGKTTMVSTLAKSLGLTFHRIQFTPDVMPSDITGFSLYNPVSGKFEHHPGAVMCQLLLADEINRTSPKTQSSLLEVMQENQVTVDGTTYPVPRPFMVLATQNPVEHVGTYPLPEAQLDRFIMRITLGYPTPNEEMEIYTRFMNDSPLHHLSPVIDEANVLALQDAVTTVFCGEPIKQLVAQIAAATRQHPDLALGVSPRGALMLIMAARGRAMLLGRNFVLPDDIIALAQPVLTHRLLMRPEGRLRQVSPAYILNEILATIPIPAAR
jgi:MoxR-like ATPase